MCYTENPEWVKKCVTQRKVQTPGTAEEHKRQETPTINPNDRQPPQLTDQASGTIKRAARESKHTTPISMAAVHAFSPVTTRHHYPHPTGSSPDPLSQRSPLQSTGRRAEPPYTTDTTRLSGDTQEGGLQHYGPRGRNGLHVLILVRGEEAVQTYRNLTKLQHNAPS